MTNPYRPFKAEILSVLPQTGIDFTFRLAADIKVESGQFVEVSLPGVGEAPISVSDFGPGWIEMTIRRVGKLTNVIHTLTPGGSLFIRGPYGKGFPVDRFTGRDLIIAAGGTGLAPVKSIVRRFYKNTAELKSLTLLAGFKSPSDVLFRDEINIWQSCINVQITVDGDDTGEWKGRVGLITKLISGLPKIDVQNTEVIIVGPPVMMKFASQEFFKKGIPEDRVWVSFERKMCCGLGKCGHCKIDDTYVCLEGPVFNYTAAAQLTD
ncbi:MAG: sulfite reductase [Peptococcaceae bacterium BICA1-7]|nr:MAG: sulfite reductase [Peptococcaceae bacterium BICA1-7]HBV98231.1 anaerobic sulfite reductase subunit AsrB [Desulfotomaculum sp.]